MRFFDGDMPGHDEVEVDITLAAGLAGAQLVKADHLPAEVLHDSGSDFGFLVLRELYVHQPPERVPQNVKTHFQDKEGDDSSQDIVDNIDAGKAYDDESDEHRRGGIDIGGDVMRVGLQRHGVFLTGYLTQITGEKDAGDDGDRHNSDAGFGQFKGIGGLGAAYGGINNGAAGEEYQYCLDY